MVEPRCASWSLQQRDQDWARAAAAAAQEALAQTQDWGGVAAAAQPASFILRSLYLPEQGMFRQMEADLQLGQRLPVCVPACLLACAQTCHDCAGCPICPCSGHTLDQPCWDRCEFNVIVIAVGRSVHWLADCRWAEVL